MDSEDTIPVLEPLPETFFLMAISTWREGATDRIQEKHRHQFADILLARQVEICVWLAQHAILFDRQGEAWEMDWETFATLFFPHFDLSVIGDVNVLRVSLSETLDELAGYKGIRDYHS